MYNIKEHVPESKFPESLVKKYMEEKTLKDTDEFTGTEANQGKDCTCTPAQILTEMDCFIRKEIMDMVCKYDKMHESLKALVKNTPSKLGCVCELKKLVQEVFIADCSINIIMYVFDKGIENCRLKSEENDEN